MLYTDSIKTVDVVSVIMIEIPAYCIGKISSRMAKDYGRIEKNQETKYMDILLPIESNLLRVNRKYRFDNGRSVVEAIQICLYQIDGYINEIEYNLDPHISDINRPYLTALLMSFDPFTNEHMRPFVEERCKIYSTEGLRGFFETPVKCLLRIEKSVELWTKELGKAGYFIFLERQLGKAITDNDKTDHIGF